MEKSEIKKVCSSTPSGWGKRHTFAILGFTGFAISYAIRFNISIAIVAMVNSSAHAPIQLGTHNRSMDAKICALELPPMHSSDEGPLGELSVFNKSITTEYKLVEDEEGEFNWNTEMQGYILGSFFWGYMLTQLPAGVISQRYGGKWCFGFGIFVPGILALLTPISARMGPAWIMAIRMIQGLGGGLTMAPAHGLLARWVPLEERGTLGPFIYTGMSFGSAITMLVSGYISHYFGWAAVFYTTGIVAIIWSILWVFLVYESPLEHPTISKDELKYIGNLHAEHDERVPTPWKEIWTSLPFWAILIGHVAETWALYTLMTEIPTYLKTVLNFEMKQNSWISAFPYLLTGIFSVLISYFGNFLLTRKLASIAVVRKFANTVALWGAAACMVGVAYSGCNRTLAVIFISLALGSLGGLYSGVLCNHIDIAPRFASILMGITNTAATSPGFLAPLVAGFILKGNPSVEQWRKVFLLGAGITFAGNLFFVLFAKGKEQNWNRPVAKPNNDKEQAITRNESNL